MSIREDIGLKDLENKLEEYEKEEDYQRMLGFDEQDEYTHLVCTKQRVIEKEIEELEDEYEKELHEIAKKVIEDYERKVKEDKYDYLSDFAYNYTYNSEESELITEYAIDNIEIIIQSKYVDKEQKLFNTIIKKLPRFQYLTFSDKDLELLKKYCEDNNFIKDINDVINDSINSLNIQCPIEFLNINKLIKKNKNYIKYGDKFLKIDILTEEIKNGKFKNIGR